MKTRYSNCYQKGFFDLGLSLVILAFFSTAAVVVESNIGDETQPELLSHSEYSMK